MTPVDSSNLSAVGYDAETQEMRVQFRSGATYSYAMVPQDIFDGLTAAESAGRFLNANVKGRYGDRKI